MHSRKCHRLRTLQEKLRLAVLFCADRQEIMKNQKVQTMKLYQNSAAKFSQPFAKFMELDQFIEKIKVYKKTWNHF